MNTIKMFMLLIVNLFAITAFPLKTPKMAILIVIDQFAQHHITRLMPHMPEGFFSKILNNGVVYNNAHHPHGSPVTATGHTALNTGTYAKDHGIILNDWLDENNNAISCIDDPHPNARVFGKKGLCKYGKSAHHIMVDGISDQLVLQSDYHKKNKVFSISYKDRAAIGLGGKAANTFWYDKKEHMFTSSKAYCKKLPEWLNSFNKKNDFANIKTVQWDLCLPLTHKIYQQYTDNTYDYASMKTQIAGKLLPGNIKFADFVADYFFVLTPKATDILLDLAQHCIDHNYADTNNEMFVLWISISSVDKAGHIYGPTSLEVIDLICHLNKQLENFMLAVQKKVGNPEDVLFMLTADHGVSPIPEKIFTKGMHRAERILVKKLITQINTHINKTYGIENIISSFKTNQLYLNKSKLKKISSKRIKQITGTIKKLLKNVPGIKEAWSYDELIRSNPHEEEHKAFFKNQLYKGRSGDIICQPEPFSAITTYPFGACHESPYNYDTHVPLIFYQPNKLIHTNIQEKVWSTQVAATLAKLLGISKPSATPFIQLPGITYND